jgi:chromatin remodeling complex protein RSC6
MTMLQFLFLYLHSLLGQWLWILLLWYLLMEHQQRNCNLLPTNLQHLEVKTEQEEEKEEEKEKEKEKEEEKEEEEEAEAGVEAGAEVEAEEHNNINFNSSPTNHQHLLHHQFHSLLLLHHLLLKIINL